MDLKMFDGRDGTHLRSQREAAFLSLRLTWSTGWVPVQLGLHRETPSQESKIWKKKKKRDLMSVSPAHLLLSTDCLDFLTQAGGTGGL